MTTPTAGFATERFVLGAAVFSTDGPCGELRRIIVDPVSCEVTHLVVGAKHHRAGGHLVPASLVDYAANGIVLTISTAQLTKLAETETTEILPAFTSAWAGMGAIGSTGRVQAVIRDSVPYGDVQVSRGDAVLATDGSIGTIRGLVTDATNEQITILLVDEGHTWRHRDRVVPVSALLSLDDGVRLTLSKAEVHELPTAVRE